MNPLPALTPQLDEGIDRRTHLQIRDRFLQVNRARLDRALDALSPRHQMFLRALPVLLHVNHPGLPGFISSATPAGIHHYRPDPAALHATAQITRTFRNDPQRPIRAQLRALFLMGSMGTAGQSSGSDLDLWVCHEAGLSETEMSELRLKLGALEQWGLQLNLEVHFFLIAPDHFQGAAQDGISSEDCGSAQRVLLLDEFYRSSLLLAGCLPLWWMVPAYDEHRYDTYARQLTSQRFLNEAEFIDFGGIPTFPAEEFIGAGLWQLYKGIASPYKSVLKLLLTEAYAAEYPATECLSLRYKRMIYEGMTDPNELDPYVMMYRKIEEHLKAREEIHRLAIVRHSFYAKANESLSRDSRLKESSWRYHLMNSLADEWEWDAAYVKQLDNRKRWKATRVRQEYRDLVHELNHSYRFLWSFVRENNIRASIGQDDMEILARKLHAAFERKAGKIEIFNYGIVGDITEEQLSLHLIQEPGAPGVNDRWVAHRGIIKQRDVGDLDPLAEARSLIQLLLICHCNRLIDSNTRFSLDAPTSDVTDNEIQRITGRLREWLPDGIPHPEIEDFRRPAHLRSVWIFINTGLDPLRSMTQRGVHYVSASTNALSYSAQHHNLVHSIDEVRINSWGEIVCHTHMGNDALIHAVRKHAQDILDGQHGHCMQFICECTSRSSLIIERVRQLYEDLQDYFSRTPHAQHTRQYVFDIETTHCIIAAEQGKALAHTARHAGDLCRKLSPPHLTWAHTRLDRHALPKHPLREVIQASIRGYIQVFISRHGRIADLYISDEKCRFSLIRRENLDEALLLVPWLRFFRAIHARRLASGESVDPGLADAHFYEITRRGQRLITEPKHTPTLETHSDWHDVHVMVERNESGEITHAIFVDDMEFSRETHGVHFHAKAARFLMNQRRGQSQYPLYITDLDLSTLNLQRDITVSTADYLAHKVRVEALLNTALNQKT